MAMELDDGGTGYGSSRPTSASEALVANVSGRRECRATRNGGSVSVAPTRGGLFTPALLTGLVRRSLARSLLSDALSAFCGVWSRSRRARVGDIVGAGDSKFRSHGWPNRVG